MSTVSVNKFFTQVESLLVKGASIASFVSGALTAANNDLPHFESAILSGAGALVFVIERYWANIKKAL